MQSRVVEILQYQLKTGTGVTFDHIMRDISVPLHLEQGIEVVTYGCSRHDSDSYFLLRAFENEEVMQSVLDEFYASEAWRSGPRKAILERIEVSLKSVLLLSPNAIDEIRNSFLAHQ
ncbi:NIPSNAP family protein [Pantoea rwandensis]|uniref:NIPSNAP family protein n=1 Tax=Pantoea rwandensis TaxID=1076550 RepID=A0A1X1CRX4_9GAMM|nr:NIPSNAP family protein [Pantoea rwandensis]ORM67193.1 NIPSNAP family protein [Pantoea rwandensis]